MYQWKKAATVRLGTLENEAGELITGNKMDDLLFQFFLSVFTVEDTAKTVKITDG